MKLDAKIPEGPIEEKWKNHKFNMKLVNPANKRKFNVIVVGTGLAGASAAATMGELGYNVQAFCFQDSPRRIWLNIYPNIFVLSSDLVDSKLVEIP